MSEGTFHAWKAKYSRMTVSEAIQREGYSITTLLGLAKRGSTFGAALIGWY